MSKLVTVNSYLLEKLNLGNDLLDAFKGEETPENADELISSYQKGRIEYLQNTDTYKSSIDELRNSTYQKTTLSNIKKINSEFGLGLTNSQMEEIKDIDEIMKLAKKSISERESELLKTTDKSLKEELNSLKEKYSDAVKSISTHEELIEKIRKEERERADSAIETELGKQYYLKLIRGDKSLQEINNPSKDYLLDAIERNIFQKYKVDRNGNITTLDGQKLVHPEKEIVINTVDELYEYEKIKANLVKNSSAGSGDKTIVIDRNLSVSGKDIPNDILQRHKERMSKRGM